LKFLAGIALYPVCQLSAIHIDHVQDCVFQWLFLLHGRGMDELTINKLRYKNFKGIKDFALEPCGKNFSVFGDNATGKTTLVDGFFRLLFGKDSRGKSDFQLKSVD